MTGDNRGDPPGARGGTQLPYRPHTGSGNQALNKPGPSNSSKRATQGTPGSSKSTATGKAGSSSTASSKREDASKKQQPGTQSRTTDFTTGLSKKERARIFDEKIAAASQRATGSSSKAEGKKPEAKAEGKKEDDKGKGKAEDKEMAAEEKEKDTKEEGKGKEKEKEKVKEEDKVEIHKRLRDTMFYV